MGRGKKVTKTTEEYIVEAKIVHGDRYGYDKTLYVGNRFKIIINCTKHGYFEQIASNHTNSRQGCPKCAREEQRMKLFLNSDTFKAKAEVIHGDKYDYSLVTYTDSKTPVEIICKSHGKFLQKPSMHLSGRGCNLCGLSSQAAKRVRPFQDFKKEADFVHNSCYEYFEEGYDKVSGRIKISCPEHGVFMQNGTHHLKGVGCPKCAVTSRSDKKRLSLDSFIERSIIAHGHRYDYSKVEYTNSRSPVVITCPEHGDFNQTPYIHMRRHGCPSCGYQIVSSSKKDNLLEFSKKANLVHNNKYNYSLFEETQGEDFKVKIICPEHGVFRQAKGHHLQGVGCPKCVKNWSGDGVVYVMCSPEGYNKIGIAKSGTEHKRLSKILRSQQTKSPTAITGLSLVCAYSFNDGSFTEAHRFEGKAHRHFKLRRKQFSDKFDGSCEFFTVPVSEICSYLEQQGGKLVTIKQ